MAELEIIEIEVSYGATLGMPGYSSKRYDQRIRAQVKFSGDLPDQLNESVAIENQLRNHVVYAAAEALGMEAGIDTEGVASLIFPSVEQPPAPQVPPPAQAQVAPQPAPPSGGGASGQGGSHGPPKATKEQIDALPRVILTVDGQPQQYIDQRPLKEQGIYKAGAADFKPEHGDSRQLWIYQKNGTVNADVAQAMQAAGVN